MLIRLQTGSQAAQEACWVGKRAFEQATVFATVLVALEPAARERVWPLADDDADCQTEGLRSQARSAGQLRLQWQLTEMEQTTKQLQQESKLQIWKLDCEREQWQT